jgi:hypothetical protein
VEVKPDPRDMPAVIVHCLSHACAALAWRRPVTLLSAPGGGCFAGCGWWRALVSAARARHPETPAADILDCADAAGRALEALRAGQKALVLLPDCPAWATVAPAAAECGALLLPARAPALDLGRHGAAQRLRLWLDGF